MADLKIYNNGENKILFSAGDRIIRQSYEFGNGISNLYGVRLKVSNIGDLYADDFSVSLLNNKKLDLNYDGILMISAAGTSPTAANYIMALGNIQVTGAWRPQGFILPTDLNKFKFFCLTKNDNIYYSYTNYSRGQGDPSSLKNVGNCDVYIGYSYDSGSFRTLSSGATISDFAFFNRYMTDDEVLYRRSNMLISDFMTLNGCICYLKLDEAEILDFSQEQDGSDLRIGCRDYSGNGKHGELLNLPAGTLQEQLDWANANLFVPFIS